jgi:prepilin-type N-terminal cleavage/methylation domain-containing protein/prepilin-type processing-associated H-X9-DG protein
MKLTSSIECVRSILRPRSTQKPAQLMKKIPKQIEAFTLIELIAVIAIVALLSAFSLCAVTRSRPQVQRLDCSNNLKQVGLASRSWAINHNGNLPMTLATSQGGASEDVGVRQVLAQQRTVSPGGAISGSRGVSMMFLVMSNELRTPKILFCPAEYESYYRQAATTFAGTQVGTNRNALYTNDLNVSYFIGVDANETRPRLFLAGDHNFGGNGNPPTTAYCTAPQSYAPSFAVWLGTNWVANMGPAFMANQHNLQANVLMADGSVEWFNRSQLQNALKNTGDNGRSPGQFLPATGATMGAGVNRIQLP